MKFWDSRLPDRFWRKVSIAGNGCWEWTGPRGRGQIRWKGSNGERRRVFVYRLTFEIEHGAIDPSLVVDHLCENPRCCNPAHLEQVTSVENTKRWTTNHPVTHCPRGHEKTDDNIYRSSGNRCRRCHADAQRAYNTRVRKPRKVRFRDTAGVIRTARCVAGLSLQDLAASLGVKHNTLSTWERGLRSVDPGVLPGIEATLGVKTEQLEAVA